MFFYSFHQFSGNDRVFRAPTTIAKKYQAGDLLRVDEQYVILLGDEVSFEEQYTRDRKGPREVIEYYPRFLQLKSIQLLHRMVAERYAPYKKIMPLFLPKELDYLLKKQTAKKANKGVEYEEFELKKNLLRKQVKKFQDNN